LEKLPFPDEYADTAIAIHVIEHFYYWDVHNVLLEWNRVLKAGGTLILELPCMNKIVKYMADCLEKNQDFNVQMTWLALWGDPRYKSVDMCHKWGYAKSQIMQELQLAGFTDVRFETPRYHVPNRDMRVVATKPTIKQENV